MKTYHHSCVSVRGMLRRGRRHLRTCLRSVFDGSGKPFRTVDDLQEALFSVLAKGHEVLPLGPVCEGFDFSGGGCPGHDKLDDVVAIPEETA